MPASRPRGSTMSRLWGNAREHAKKDDDRLPPPGLARQGGHWQPIRTPRRHSLIRLVAYAFIAFLIVIGVSSTLRTRSNPAVDHAFPETNPSVDIPPDAAHSSNENTEHKSPQIEQKEAYDGPVLFPWLAQSLNAIGSTQGNQPKNRNVLFAAASLKSAATLLPMACQMASVRQNYVHFAFFGRSDIPLKELLKINGVGLECPVILHDPRPDSHATSTENRMMMAAARALYYINMYMHPQAILVDSTRDEEDYLLAGIRDQVRSVGGALIELPERPATRLSWIAKLDSGALAAWDKVHIDILIHAPRNGVGNLRRLLTSLAEVDIGGMSIPHLTIELPYKIESQLEELLGEFQWPPQSDISGHRPHMLSLRHRIPRPWLTEEESTIRFLESFWPTNPVRSNVLVLSPHTQVTRQFLHYVKYSLLHYRHSNAATIQNWDAKLMGLSFASPTTLLDGSAPLSLPEPDDDTGSSFLWQAPGSDAMLFSGSKWVELHGYISQVLDRQHSSSASPALLARKEVSKKYPSWLEYALQLSRLRGYYTVYPGRETTSVILGVHNDLPQPPEEYANDAEARRGAEGKGLADDATYLFDPNWQVDILHTLPQDGTLPYLTHLPVLTWDGKSTSTDELHKNGLEFAARFRREVGQCKDEETSRRSHRLARDLFCKSSDEN